MKSDNSGESSDITHWKGRRREGDRPASRFGSPHVRTQLSTHSLHGTRRSTYRK